MRRPDMEARTQAPRGSSVMTIYCKRMGGGYGVRETKLPQERFLVGPFETSSRCWHVVIG